MIRLNDVNAELENMFGSREISKEYVKTRKQIEDTKQRMVRSENIVTEKNEMAQNYSMFNIVFFKICSILFVKCTWIYAILCIPCALFLFTEISPLCNDVEVRGILYVAWILVYFFINLLYFGFLGMLLSLVICFVFSLLISAIAHLVTLKYQKKKKAQFLSEAETEKSKIISYEQELKELDIILKQYSDTLNATSVVPEIYWQYIEELCNIVSNRRANDLTSAINVLEDILHKIRVEDAQLKQIDMLRCNSEELVKIKRRINDISVNVYVHN